MTRQEVLQIAKPILFNTEMVRAILEDRKSCTRRIMRFKGNRNPSWSGYIKDGLVLYNGNNEPCNEKPRYNVGDILYVRETWTYHENAVGGFIFKARCPERVAGSKRWYPSIHMPKEAARIFLKVTGVRVERLQDMTEEDALKEGVDTGVFYTDDETLEIPALRRFPKLWNSTIKKSDIDKYGWNANPWVFVIEFTKIDITEE